MADAPETPTTAPENVEKSPEKAATSSGENWAANAASSAYDKPAESKPEEPKPTEPKAEEKKPEPKKEESSGWFGSAWDWVKDKTSDAWDWTSDTAGSLFGDKVEKVNENTVKNEKGDLISVVDSKDFEGDSFWDISSDDISNYFSKDAGVDKGVDTGKGYRELPDGTKIANDGSWFEFSETANEKAAKGEKIEHSFKDADGKDVKVEVKDGKVIYTPEGEAAREITQKHIRVNENGTETIVDKETGAIIREVDGKRIYERTPDGQIKVLLDDGKTMTRKLDGTYEITRPDGTKTSEVSEKEIKFFGDADQKVQVIMTHQSEAEARKAVTRDGTTRAGSNFIIVQQADGTTIKVAPNGNTEIETKEGFSIRRGRNGEIKTKGPGETEWKVSTIDKLPENLRQLATKKYSMTAMAACSTSSREPSKPEKRS